MCAILDANCRDEVFGKGERPEATRNFLSWLVEGRGTLVIGGKLKKELGQSESFAQWYRQANLCGKIINFDDDLVDEEAEILINDNSCKSNDQHVIALARVSGARLLYSNDSDLHSDFRNRELIQNPRGKIYSTKEHKKFVESHKNLLRNRNLCRN